MNKLAAIRILVREGQTEQQSTSAAKLVVGACRALGLTDDEVRNVMCSFGYCDEGGTPYINEIERVWP